MTDWTARRNDSESGSLRKDGRMSAKDRPVFFTDIPDPWAGRLAVASSVQWWEPPNPPRIRAHTEILDSLAPLVFDLLAEGWDAAVRSMCYKDGTPVEIVVNSNPYRRPTA